MKVRIRDRRVPADQDIVADHDLELALGTRFRQLTVSIVVADVTDSTRMDGVFNAVRPDVIFHAPGLRTDEDGTKPCPRRRHQRAESGRRDGRSDQGCGQEGRLGTAIPVEPVGKARPSGGGPSRCICNKSSTMGEE